MLDNLRFKQVPLKREHSVCGCGREIGRHCPECGSISKFTKQANSTQCQFDPVEGTFAIARGFICRKCGCNYNEVTECVAPEEVKKTQLSRIRSESKQSRQVVINEAVENVRTVLDNGPIDPKLLEWLEQKKASSFAPTSDGTFIARKVPDSEQTPNTTPESENKE